MAASILDAALVLSFLYVAFIMPILIDRTRWINMEELRLGIIGFNTFQGHLPSRLEEVVKKGFLPNASPIYSNPIGKWIPINTTRSWASCEYEFSFSKELVTIKVPASRWTGLWWWFSQDQSGLEAEASSGTRLAE